MPYLNKPNLPHRQFPPLPPSATTMTWRVRWLRLRNPLQVEPAQCPQASSLLRPRTDQKSDSDSRRDSASVI